MKAENRELTKAVFTVAWFDVSEEVLDGLKGVERVYSHFLGSKEANTVWYDPTLVNIEQIENALKDGAGYLTTVNWSTRYWVSGIGYTESNNLDNKTRRAYSL